MLKVSVKCLSHLALLMKLWRGLMMSEKRFELVSVCGDFGIIDTITDEVWFFETYESVVKVVDLLNELHEENMGLRAKYTQMVIIMKDVVKDLKRIDTYRYAEHLEKIANLRFLSEKELEDE